MRIILLGLSLIVLSLAGMAQSSSSSKNKEVKVVKTVKAVKIVYDTTAYPIFGTFRITEAGSTVSKNLEFWVLDAKGREIYYVVQGIPTTEAFADIIGKLIDHEYTEFMMKHGYVQCKKGFIGDVSLNQQD